MRIVGASDKLYCKVRMYAGLDRFNGAYYYAKEIENNIIPRVITDRNWFLISSLGYIPCPDHTIVFIHNNLNPERYEWLKDADDLILVCGVPETCEKVAHLGKTVYLPLSVDTRYVAQYKKFRPKKKLREVAFVGRENKLKLGHIPEGTDIITNMNRTSLLKQMAKYKKVYAVGRTAIEAKILGCEVLPYDTRFPDPSVWDVIDNRTAAKILQSYLDIIDGGKYGN